MAGRRSVLNGASDWEREERAFQQREYAALLQEQVRQKNAKQEMEKAQRHQEQQAEREMMRQHEAPPVPVMQLPHQSAPSSSKSPMRMAQVPSQILDNPFAPPAEGPSVAGLNSYHQPPNGGQGINMEPFVSSFAPGPSLGSPMKFPSAPHLPAFSPGPSIFESLLREPGIGMPSTKFNDDLAALHRLTSEIDVLSRQQRLRAQSYAKPSFILRPESPAPPLVELRPVSASSDMETFETTLNAIEQERGVDGAEYEELLSRNALGLGEESELVPIHSVPQRPSPQFSRKRPSPAQKFGPVSTQSDSALLSHHSEMLAL